MGLHFDIVDVFTDRAYAGNPLAVVHRARTLTAAADAGDRRGVRAVGDGVHAAADRRRGATYRLRIFTPARELPFAGHPSVGAAWALAFADMIRAGDVVQECGAGLLPVRVDAAGARVAGGAPEVGPDLPGDALARDGRARRGRPRRRPAGRGRGGRGAVRVPAGAAGRRGPGGAGRGRGPRGDGRPDGARGRGRRPGTGTAHVRVFCPQVGVVEDPATGSAAVALGVFLAARGVLPEGRRR